MCVLMFMFSVVILQQWVKSAGGTVADENFYAASVRELLVVTDETAYEIKVSELSERWSPVFVDYYTSVLEPAVLASYECTTASLGIVAKPYVGITNNVSESFNRVLKDFQNWKVFILRIAVANCWYLLLLLFLTNAGTSSPG